MDTTAYEFIFYIYLVGFFINGVLVMYGDTKREDKLVTDVKSIFMLFTFCICWPMVFVETLKRYKNKS